MDQITLAEVILASMTDGVITLDQAGHISAINPAAQAILGLDRSLVLGQLYAEVFFAFQANDDFNQMLLDLVTTQEERPYAEVSFLRQDGETRILALTTSLLVEPQTDKRLGAVLVFKDITAVHSLRRQRDSLAQELAQKHEELRQAYLKLEERNRSLHEAQRRVFWVKLGVVGLVVILFSALTFLLWRRGAVPSLFDAPGPAAEAQGPQMASWRKFAAKRGDIVVTVPGSGYVEPLKVVTVAAEVAGRVVECTTHLGDRVALGRQLLRLDPSEVLPKVRQAEADLLKARERFREIETWSHRPDFLEARRSLEMAHLNLDQQKKRSDQAERLYKQGFIALNELDEAQTQLRRAQSEVAAATDRLTQTKERGSPEKLKVARLEMQNAEAALREAKLKLDHTEIYAPIAGVIMLPKTGKEDKPADLPEVGAQVQAGQALFCLGANQPLGVRLRVDEVEVRQTQVGQKALVSVQALGDKRLTGVVRSVAPQAELVKGQPTFPVIIELEPLSPEMARHLRLGISALVKIVVNEARAAVLVPIVALAHRQGGEAVRVEEGGEVRWRPVTTGLSDQEFVQIIQGIKPGEVVLY